MDRRVALKNMGTFFGYSIATPTLIGLIQSCERKPSYADWIPEFLDKSEGQALAQLLDIILPKTDTPSATELGIHTFIDSFAKEVLPNEEKSLMKMTMSKFFDKVVTNAEKESLAKINAEDIEPILVHYLKKQSDEQEENQNKAVSDYLKGIKNGQTIPLDDDTARFYFATSIRGLAIWAFKTSKEIGENVLAYDPVPGTYISCGNLDDLTGGKAWSL